MGTLRNALKQSVYRLAKYGGGFTLARRRSRGALRILCYHGIWPGDNRYFSSTLYMSPQRFAERAALLARLDYPLLSLDEALRRLDDGTLPDGATVITIDDGWYGTYRYMLPALERHGLPATIYVASYFAVKQTPVTQLAITYLLKRSTRDRLDLDALAAASGAQIGHEAGQVNGGTGAAPSVVALGDAVSRERLAARLNAAADRLDSPGRQRLCRALGRELDVDYDQLVRERWLDLMTPDELRDVAARGFDLQLHTHRHRISVDGADCLDDELRDNRAVLEPIAGRPLRHFCYPSGIYTPDCWPQLERLGVTSATTCRVGLNRADTPRLALYRILDAEPISALEIEAELSGFGELLRGLRRALRRR